MLILDIICVEIVLRVLIDLIVACCILKQATDEKEAATTKLNSVTEEAATAKQELEQTRARIETLETKLQAALLEVEVVKASEESALSQVSRVLLCYRFLTFSAVIHEYSHGG